MGLGFFIFFAIVLFVRIMEHEIYSLSNVIYFLFVNHQAMKLGLFVWLVPLLMTYVSAWCFKYAITQTNKVRSVDFSPDGSMLALGMEDFTVKVYDAYTFSIKFSFTAPDKPYALKFNGQSTILAVGSLHNDIKIINTSSWAITTITSTQAEVHALDFNSDSTVMLSCGKNNELRLWTTTTWSNTSITPTLPDQGGTDFKACQFTSTNNIIVGDSTGIVRTFASPYLLADVVGSSIDYGNTLTSVSNRYTTVDYIVSENGNKKGWASFDSSNAVYTAPPSKTVETTSYARTLDYFMFGGNDKKVLLYNATNKNNSLVQSMTVTGSILSSDFTHDGKYLVVGADDNIATIYSQFCVQCDASYYFNSTTKLCDLCANTLDFCASCYSNSACAICVQGFYVTTGKICATCNSAMIGCNTCNSSSYCTSPLPGYYVNTGTAATCESIMPGCLICNSSTVCLQCHNEYYVSSSKCAPCSGVANCLKCYNGSYCTQCVAGYYSNTAVANTATCSRCSTNCLDCGSASVCYECVVGYYTTGGNCLACSTGCLACNNTNYCLDCITNSFNSGGSCVSCTAPCLTCVATATTCLSCYPGYFFDGTSACTACPTGCTSCTGSAVCLSCLEGYYYVSANTTCIRCSSTYTGCQSCNSTNCTACLTSFYYDGTANLCKSCSTSMHGCVLCSAASTCLFCAPGHYLSALTGNNSCQPCGTGCSTCETNNNCTACVPGYYFDSSTWTCLKCSSKCVTCTSPTFCISCVIGYYMQNTATGTCQACNATKAYCLSCIYDSSNALQCTQCGVGFHLNSGSCSRCSSNCVTCSASSTCLTCELGFYFNSSDSTCKTCSPYCSECSTNGTCESCQVGYYLSSPNCLPCTDVGCLTCRADTKCLSCISGYYLVPVTLTCNTCASVTALSNCLECSASTTCTQCAYGYALTTSGANTVCSTCSSMTGCFHCSSLSVCLACQSGYWLNGNICSACPEGCRNCVNGTYCMSCGSSYFSGNVLGAANMGSCLRCEFYLDGCELCSDNNNCSNCQSGFYLTSVANNTLCKLCEVNMPQCTLCNSSSVCTSCKGGYYLTSNNSGCIQCSTTFPSCRLCDRLGTTCTDCQSSYYLSGNNCLLCSSNLPGCQVCTAATTCVECSSGYFLNSPNCQLCSSTMSGCIFCNSSNVCLQCQAGYYLHSTNFSCVPCAVAGCQICVQASPTSCVTCNSLYFKSSATSCTICRTPLPGCLTCTDSTTCSKCDVGYYQNAVGATPQCLLCSDAMQGCSICSSSTVCLECKSMYFLNSTSKCQVCSVPMTGCTFCTNNSVCLSCGSGYFKNTTSLCQSCTDLPGCLVCKDSSTCLFCDTGYYFNSFACQTCTVIPGCYSCISSTVCSSCIGGYTLNSNNMCDVAQVQAASKVEDIMLKTFYQNATTLKHYLYVKGKDFSKNVKLNWQANATLYIYNNAGNKINLVIKDVQFSTENSYTLIFYTDNPLDLSTKTKKMPFARLLSQSLDLSDSKTGIQLSDEALQQLLPGYQHSGSLVLDYNLDNPEFYASYTKQYISPFPFYAISATIVGLVFLKFLVKSLITVPRSSNLGNIIPHILAFKVGALLLFPTYFEYINYCSGFMYADFPWLNRFFGEKLADQRDIEPDAYSIFYDNMNLASMYLLALSIFILLAFIALLVGKSLPKQEYKMYSFLSFLYNFFSFGLFFAGCASLQGAIMNPISSLSVNSVFYIIGILVYFSMVCECIYRLSQDKALYFWKIRILMKATLLSMSHYSPIYLLASTVVIDLVLIIVEYQLNPYSKTYSKSWIFANVTCNLALVLLVFLPIIALTMVMVSACLFLVIVAEGFMHYQETREKHMVKRLDMTQNAKDDDRNLWQLNFNADKELKKIGDTSENFRETNANFGGENMETMYPKEGSNKKNQNMEETQVLGKYKRQRNYKKVREEAKGKRMQIEDINNKSNPNNQSNQSHGDQKLTFMVDEV